MKDRDLARLWAQYVRELAVLLVRAEGADPTPEVAARVQELVHRELLLLYIRCARAPCCMRRGGRAPLCPLRLQDACRKAPWPAQSSSLHASGCLLCACWKGHVQQAGRGPPHVGVCGCCSGAEVARVGKSCCSAAAFFSGEGWLQREGPCRRGS